MVATSSSPSYIFRYTYGTFPQSSHSQPMEITDTFGAELLCCLPSRLQVPAEVQDADSVSHGTQEAHAQAARASPCVDCSAQARGGSRRRRARLSLCTDLPGFRHAGPASCCRLPVAFAPWNACVACPGCFPAPCSPGGPCVRRP